MNSGTEKDKPGVNWCTGYDPPRNVHPAVCAWHRSENDSKCQNCEHFKNNGDKDNAGNTQKSVH